MLRSARPVAHAQQRDRRDEAGDSHWPDRVDRRVGRVAASMLLGALVDAGASLANVRSAVEAVIPGTVRITAAETTGRMRASRSASS